MPQYLVAFHHPDDYDPCPAAEEAIPRDIVALNVEMKAAAESRQIPCRGSGPPSVASSFGSDRSRLIS